MKISFFTCYAFFLLINLLSAIQLATTHDIRHEYCWRDSYGRGVGTIPSDCGQYEKLGLLCYDRCPTGYKRFVLDCHQECPPGFTSQGLFCRHKEYGRGVGFPWKIFDGFSDKGMFERCEAQHGKGNCEKHLLIVYPKCKPGYHNFGCCICRPSVPDCRKLGMNGGFDLSCAKYIKIGKPHTAKCPQGKQNNAGLCYHPCKLHYIGVGPVCWMSSPKGWVDCGMASAISSAVCRNTILDSIGSVASVAFNIAAQVATLGAATPAIQAKNAAVASAKMAKSASQFSKLVKTVKSSSKIKQMINIAKKGAKLGKKMAKKTKTIRNAAGKMVEIFDNTEQAIETYEQINNINEQKLTDADKVRLAAQIASMVDPTGIAAVVQSFSHPKCTEIMNFEKDQDENEEEEQQDE